MEIIKDDSLYRLYVSKNGQLRMILGEMPKGLVRAINITDMSICGLSVTDDMKGKFCGSGNLGRYVNKVNFKD